jgi:hypothetical protein
MSATAGLPKPLEDEAVSNPKPPAHAAEERCVYSYGGSTPHACNQRREVHGGNGRIGYAISHKFVPPTPAADLSERLSDEEFKRLSVGGAWSRLKVDELIHEARRARAAEAEAIKALDPKYLKAAEYLLRNADKHPSACCPECAAGLAERDALAERVAELEKEKKLIEEAWDADKESAKWAQTCGCMVDKVTNVCLVHSPAVRKAEARVAALTEALRSCHDRAKKRDPNKSLENDAMDSCFAVCVIAQSAIDAGRKEE